MLTPAFHFKILEDFQAVMNDQCAILIDKLKALEPGQPVDIFPYLTFCALDIISESAMGKKLHAQSQSENPYIKSLLNVAELVIMRNMKPWLINE